MVCCAGQMSVSQHSFISAKLSYMPLVTHGLRNRAQEKNAHGMRVASDKLDPFGQSEQLFQTREL